PAAHPPLATRRDAPAADIPPARPANDEGLSGEVDLATLESLVLARHPAIGEATERIRAASERATSAASLPPTELMGELWQVPLSRPYRIDQAGMIMTSVRQTITPLGAREGMAEAAAHEAEMAIA